MITARELIQVTTLKSNQLSELLKGKPDIQSAEFLGITNGGQFCYSVTLDNSVFKVFITRRNDGSLGADLL